MITHSVSRISSLRVYLLLGLCLFLATPLFSEKATSPLDGYDRLLSTYVNADGRVDYKGLAAERAVLDQYTAHLAAIDEASYATWNDPEQMAMWINAYNAYTLISILDAYPIKRRSFLQPKNSIRQIKGVWDTKTWKVAGKDVTLDMMEHERLRKDWKEPRIHMAIVCASIGCPVLRPSAYRGETLDDQLTEQAKAFFAEKRNFNADIKRGTLELSKLFEWFGGDFGDLAAFAAPYLDPPTAAFLKQGEYKKSYIKYDWTLNEQ